MKRIFLLFIASLICFCSVGCKTTNENKMPSSFSNLAYGTDSSQIMDIILPSEEDSNGGVMLLIHGGAWIEGDKKNGYTDDFMEKYRDSGYIVATMNYRTASESVKIDDMLDDVRSALNYIKKLSEESGLTADKAMLVGWSSGGHMAELYGYSMANSADIEVTCVTGYSGICDITDKDLYIDNPLDEILNRPMTDVVSLLCGYKFDGDTLSEVKPYLEKASPICYTDTAVPTIICHSEADTYVNYSTAVHLKNELESQNIDVTFIDFPKSGHDLLLDPESLESSYIAVSEYAEKYLQ